MTLILINSGMNAITFISLLILLTFVYRNDEVEERIKGKNLIYVFRFFMSAMCAVSIVNLFFQCPDIFTLIQNIIIAGVSILTLWYHIKVIYKDIFLN